MISFENVSRTYGENKVLSDISVELTEQRIGIIGANGSGKSTFARLINGLVQPSTGTVWVNGIDVAKNKKSVRKQVGFVFQNPDHQIVMPLVREDVAFGLKMHGVEKSERPKLASAKLDEFGLAHMAEQACHTLSGGEKQMVAIIGALILDPSVLILDEPTALLDLTNTNLVMKALSSLRQQILLVTHDLERLREFDRVLVFDQGRIVADAPPDKAIARYVELMT